MAHYKSTESEKENLQTQINISITALKNVNIIIKRNYHFILNLLKQFIYIPEYFQILFYYLSRSSENVSQTTEQANSMAIMFSVIVYTQSWLKI